MDATAQELIARLRRNPNDADAFHALRGHYQRIGDYASLANLLEGWAGRATDPAAAAAAFFEAGELVLGALNDRERAIRIYERGLATDPRHTDTFGRLRGLFEEAGETRRQADLLEHHAEALSRAGGAPREVALVYHQLGELWEHRFQRVDKAVNHYRKAFELDPTLVAAIYAAREIYRKAGNLKAAASLCEMEAKAEPDPVRKLALWKELAHTRADELGDLEGAVLALKRALAAAPNEPDSMSHLARIHLARAERSDDPRVAAADRHRAADLLFQLAQHPPADRQLAYLEQALDAHAEHEGALALYEHVAEQVGQPQRLPARWVAYLARVPDGTAAAHRRKRLAEAYMAAGQLDYAVTCLEWLLEERDPEAADRLVELYRHQGREDDALRALGVAAAALPPDARALRLRELMQTFRLRGELEPAAAWAQEILRIDPADPEALALIEDACRHKGDFSPLREALLAASRIAGLGVEPRKQRLREVAVLSEEKLGDVEGSIAAWRAVAAIDPADREARAQLKRLLTHTERWDDVVQVLEREAIATTDPAQKAEVYRELARTHRDRRGDLASAIVALRHLRDLSPEDRAARDGLCDALLEAGAFLEAIPLLRQRVDDGATPARAELLRTLASVLEEHVGDEDGAFDVWARLLDEIPSDAQAMQRMEAIDEQAGRWERLLSTLSYRVEVSAPEERAAIFVRMGSIADQALRDLDRAAELYARALELSPADAATLEALCGVYERAERFRDLVVLLRERAQSERDPALRAELYRRIARMLATRVGNDAGAAEAWQEVLRSGEDEEALRFLRKLATKADDAEALAGYLDRLGALTADRAELRDILLERADLLADRLGRPHEAITALRRVVDELQPDHVMALARLASLCEQVGDRAGLADALWRQLEVVEDAGLRLPVTRRLADLHEHQAPDAPRAIAALSAWADADPGDDEPLRRLVGLLERTERWAELVGALDALSGLSPDEGEAGALARRAADVAYRRLGDVDGAWARLLPRVREGEAESEAALR
ncbi:MAG: hypothetical protein IT378_23145, partial [Sandaracinaceae bacterium]|nr:hypothetical protein [Sandaracinaceae bacterium]